MRVRTLYNEVNMQKNYQGRKYVVIGYNSKWQQAFQKEAEVLYSVLGSDALQIEHIGSTAVPGLAGKPTLDVLVVVSTLSVTEKHLSKMIAAGYKDLGEYVLPGTRLFVREKDGKRLVNTHFFPEGHPHINEMLSVRDHLRSHPEEVKAYGELKQALAKQYPDDYGAYRKKKDEYMRDLLKRAQAGNVN